MKTRARHPKPKPRPTRQTTALVRRSERPIDVPEGGDPFVTLMARLAASRDVDMAKLEKMIDLQERIMRHNAKAAFNVAYVALQSELPEISKRGKIIVKGTFRSAFAKLEDIHQVIKPILTRHRFSLRHRTEWPTDKPKIIRIVGILSHADGHSEESSFEAPMDQSDFRTDIQSQGSTVSYGRRYTTIDLLNITTRGIDNDGQSTTRQYSAPIDAEPVTRSDKGVPSPGRTPTPPTGDPIGAAAVRRLETIIVNSGRTLPSVLAWLQRRYGWTSTAAVTKPAYAEVCAAIESPEDLP